MVGRVFFILLAGLLALPLRAIENSSTGTFNETAPTDNNITNWQSGWTQPATEPTGYTYTTGWNYVGSVDGSGAQASGVYLGNGWVITCAHVGAGNFKLNGVTYSYVANTLHTFTGTLTTKVTSSSGTTTTSAAEQADFIVFGIADYPNLPLLPLRTTDPVRNSSQVAMIGYGDGGSLTNETWGYNALGNYVDDVVNLFSFWTNDFETLTGTGSEYEVISGDSGGGDFIYNSSLGRWELAGLNEAELTNNGTPVGSAFVQLDNSSFLNVYNNTPSSGETTTYSGTTTYATQLQFDQYTYLPAAETPALPPWGMVALGALLVAVAVPPILLERR